MARRSGQTVPPERLVFGKNPVMELVLHHPERLEVIYVVAAGRRQHDLDAHTNKLNAAAVRIEFIDRDELDRLTAGGVHQGIAAKLRSALKQNLDDLMERCRSAKTQVLVALDEVTDPHNLGAVLRACECAGVAGVIVPKHRSAHLTPTVRKSSAGASEHVALVEVTNLAQALREAKRRSFWIIGTAISKNSQKLFAANLPTPSIVVFGAEGKGIRPVILEQCDILLEIPMLGRVQSLNVSQASAVVLFEYVRRGH